MEKEKNLKVAGQPQLPVPEQQGPPSGYLVPAEIMEQIFAYIGQGAWLKVNELINLIRQTSQPVFPKTVATNEATNQSTPNA